MPEEGDGLTAWAVWLDRVEEQRRRVSKRKSWLEQESARMRKEDDRLNQMLAGHERKLKLWKAGQRSCKALEMEYSAGGFDKDKQAIIDAVGAFAQSHVTVWVDNWMRSMVGEDYHE